MKEYPPGLLALSCSETARYSSARLSIESLQRPVGSQRIDVMSLSIASNFNSAVRKMLEIPELQWIFLMNDDHVYPPDTLMRLLEHDVLAVTALYVERVIPFGPVLFDRVADGTGHVLRYPLPGYEQSGLVPIVACGDGAMLVRRSVFERIPEPWWAFGEVDVDRCDHDLAFCSRLRDADVPIFVDLKTVVDHVTPLTLRPVQMRDGSWTIQLRDHHGRFIEAVIALAAKPEEVGA
jgi:hypothetical protein